MARKLSQTEYDSVYFLKILLYLILGTIWLSQQGHRILPIGLLLGLLAVQHERLQIDRKIEYAMLLIGGVLGLVGIGITFSI